MTQSSGAASPLTKIHSVTALSTQKEKDSMNPVVNSQTNNSKCFKRFDSKTDILKFSYFPRTILDWNQLEEHQVQALSPEAFRSALRGSSSSE